MCCRIAFRRQKTNPKLSWDEISKMHLSMLEKKSLNILIVDDDEDDFFITSEYLKKIQNGYQLNIEWCGRYKEALTQVCDGKHDIYFVDFRLGAKNGLDLIKEAIKASCQHPMILLTGKGNQEIDIMAMEAGAVDYLVKSELNVEKLERCIRYALGRFEYIKALKANEQKFRLFFEKSKDSVFLAEENLQFRDVNQGSVNLTDYTKNELLAMTLYDLFVNKDEQQLVEQELQTKGEIADKEIELFSKSKEKINCILTVSREMDGKGEVYMQGIIHNITILKKSEKAALHTEKLNAAQRLLRILAHEVRNPVNNIYLALEQLGPVLKEEEPRDLVEIIDRNSRRINALITELLDTSRPIEIVLEKLALQQIMDETIAVALDRITLKKIKLSVNYLASNAWIMADKTQLKIAFLNIVINAIEAMKEDEGKLIIEIKKETSGFLVSILDNGKGISEENLTRLFEPYFTSKPTGMGLGLASTLNIIKAHKGMIEVKSVLDEGTGFYISFDMVE